MSKKSALIILDGFGITPERKGNAVLGAKMPFFNSVIVSYPSCLLKASAEEVGLPWGETGSSEVGHTNIGLGRVVLQDLPQIDKILAENKLATKKAIVKTSAYLGESPANVNIIFLSSDGGIHGHIRHVPPVVNYFKTIANVKKIILHIIADGRDVGEKTVITYLKQIEPLLDEKTVIGSISGRYFAMDRDKNYDRTEKAYNAIIGKGTGTFPDVKNAIDGAYAKNETDEFLTPRIIGGVEKPDVEKDVFIFTNFRADRAIQLSRAFTDESFNDFNRENIARHFVCMTTFEDNLKADVIFSNIDLYDKDKNPLDNSLSKLLSSNSFRQSHIAETEKFAHITYFFSGGIKEPFPGQNNILIPSEKVKSYDLFPRMRAKEITEKITAEADGGSDFIIANYANGDMVGHSGNYDKVVESLEFVDNCLKEGISHLLTLGYEVFLTSDHGNCDEMIDLKNDKPSKEHSLNPAPFIFISKESYSQNGRKAEDFFAKEPIGILADIAPTMTKVLGVENPAEFSGVSLINSLS